MELPQKPHITENVPSSKTHYGFVLSTRLFLRFVGRSYKTVNKNKFFILFLTLQKQQGRKYLFDPQFCATSRHCGEVKAAVT